MATSWYVDGTNGNDTTGDGTSHATAYQTVQKIFDTHTRDNSGDRINVTGSHTLSSALDPTAGTWGGAPSTTQPLRFAGYTSTEGDGGTGTINGGGGSIWIQSAAEGTVFENIHFTNFGASNAVHVDRYNLFLNCEFSVGTGTATNAALRLVATAQSHVIGCHFHDVGTGIVVGAGTVVDSCFFANDGATDMNEGIYLSGTTLCSAIINNIFSLDGTSDGISGGCFATAVRNNTFFTTGTGIAIDFTRQRRAYVMGNYFEGWNKGIDTATTSEVTLMYGYNAYFNNTNADTIVGELPIALGGDQTLSGTGLNKSGSATTFSNRFAYFKPIDTNDADMFTGGWPEVNA